MRLGDGGADPLRALADFSCRQRFAPSCLSFPPRPHSASFLTATMSRHTDQAAAAAARDLLKADAARKRKAAAVHSRRQGDLWRQTRSAIRGDLRRRTRGSCRARAEQRNGGLRQPPSAMQVTSSTATRGAEGAGSGGGRSAASGGRRRGGRRGLRRRRRRARVRGRPAVRSNDRDLLRHFAYAISLAA